MSMFDIPIVLIVYKRLDTTKEVFSRIREIKPAVLYIVSDGARNDEELMKINKVRTYIESNIDWECKVYKNYSKKNMGVRYRIPTGLDWVFTKEDKAIILEDDVCPSIAFFHFCREMLYKYENEEKIMMITGFNPYDNFKIKDTMKEDIFITRYPNAWGWATWKRAWKKYKPNIPNWEEVRKKKLLKRLRLPKTYRHLTILFDELQYHWYTSWLYQWYFAMIIEDGYGIVSKRNLTKNIGINHIDAEHPGDNEEREKSITGLTVDEDFVAKNFPSTVEVNNLYDKYVSLELEKNCAKTSIMKWIKYSIRAAIHRKAYNNIKKIENDKEYFNFILPQKFKLNEEEIKWNNGQKFRLISPKQLRYCSFVYVFYLYTKKNLYEKTDKWKEL